MKRFAKAVAGTMMAAGLALGATACATNDSADVLQYGDYSTGSYVAYSQPIVVHVSRKIYMSDSREFSTPTYERTYIHTHTVVHRSFNGTTYHTTTTRTTTRKH